MRRHHQLAALTSAALYAACQMISGVGDLTVVDDDASTNAGGSSARDGGSGGWGTGATGGVAGGAGATGGVAGGAGAGTGASSGSAGASGATSGGGGVAGAQGGTAGAGGCTPSTATIAASADSAMFHTQCNGSIVHGTDPYSNVGSGRAFLRFTLTTELVNALLTGKVQSMSLKLSRSVDCEGSPVDCGGTQVTGSFQVFPLRNDWVEGLAGQTYSGADWCRRTSGNPGSPWNAPGADADHAPAAGTMTIDGNTNNVAIPLDAGKWNATWIANDEISVLVVAASGMFVHATRESAKYPHPLLEFVTCP